MKIDLEFFHRGFGRLWIDLSGVALIEFALSLPIILILGLSGLEVANFALAHQRISQIASMAADNASRPRIQITESFVNELFTGVEMSGSALNLKGHGRVILSSIQRDPDDVTHNLIGWQRCFGTKAVISEYGKQGEEPSDTLEIKPIGTSALMLAEVSYDYQPIIPNSFLQGGVIKYHSAYIVRQRTNQNITGTTTHTCPA